MMIIVLYLFFLFHGLLFVFVKSWIIANKCYYGFEWIYLSIPIEFRCFFLLFSDFLTERFGLILIVGIVAFESLPFLFDDVHNDVVDVGDGGQDIG